MKKKNRKHTIGDWLEELGATLRNRAYWTMYRRSTGTYHVVKMHVDVVDASGTTMATAMLECVHRGADYPHEAQWRPGSLEVAEANQATANAETRDMSNLPAIEFVGINRAMPWELREPPAPKSLLRLMLEWLHIA